MVDRVTEPEGDSTLQQLQQLLANTRRTVTSGCGRVRVEAAADGGLHGITLADGGERLDGRLFADLVIEAHRAAVTEAEAATTGVVDDLLAKISHGSEESAERKSTEPVRGVEHPVRLPDAPIRRGRPVAPVRKKTSPPASKATTPEPSHYWVVDPLAPWGEPGPDPGVGVDPPPVPFDVGLDLPFLDGPLE